MGVWRLAAGGTHLYPGARMRVLAGDVDARLRDGDTMLLEFGDGNVVTARVRSVTPQALLLEVDAHATRRGAAIATKRWRVAPAGDGAMRVTARAG